MDFQTLWDFDRPEVSEQRFRAALEGAGAEEAFILQTQIARTYGLRGDFTQAQAILTQLANSVGQRGAEARIYYYLELGRALASATHPPETQTTEVKEQARTAYLSAVQLAQVSGLDDLAIDALHMLTFVDTEPAAQLEWDRKALELMHASTQEKAKRWTAALHNNTGYALHLLGRYTEADEEFQLALEARKQRGDPGALRIAEWMVAWNYRALGRLDEALEIQLRLEQESAAAGEPDPYVFEELALLYQTLGQPGRAAHYTSLHQK